jgi:hypothetical protein
MNRIYLTHCSKEKDLALKTLGRVAAPDVLYTNPGIQQFMVRCKEAGVSWAVLSDLYGVFQADEQYGWYEKHPDTVTQQEEDWIIQEFDRKLASYDEIWFYIRSDTFHPFYARVLKRTRLAERVRTFEDLEAINFVSVPYP